MSRSRRPSKTDQDNQANAQVMSVIKDRQTRIAERVQNTSNKKAVEYLAKQEFTYDRLEEVSKKFASRTWVPTYKGKKNKLTERALNLVLSDLHYGADLDPRLVPFQFGPQEESRRTAGVIAEVADYKRQYRAETELNVHLIGDIIQGKLHDVQSAAALTIQYDRAIHHLVHAIEFLATEFKQVTVRCSVGNHGRDAARHPDRAMQDKFDSHEFRIYRALYWALSKVPNVTVETPLRGYYLYEQFGQKGLMTHGDTIFKPGFPGSAIQTSSLEAQVNKFRLSAPEHYDVKLYGFGHVHTPMDVSLNDHVVLVTNGCLIPTDDYAQSISLFATPCSQQLWETVPGYMFGDHRLLRVGVDQDKDKTLDSVIPPWKPLQ